MIEDYSSQYFENKRGLSFAQQIAYTPKPKRSWFKFSLPEVRPPKPRMGISSLHPLIDQCKYGRPRGGSAGRRALENSKIPQIRPKRMEACLAMILLYVKSHCKGRRWTVSISLMSSYYLQLSPQGTTALSSVSCLNCISRLLMYLRAKREEKTVPIIRILSYKIEALIFL